MQNVTATLENSWQFLKKLNIQLYDPVIALLGINPRQINAYILTKICAWVFIVSSFVTVKTGALADVAQWIEYEPENQRVAGSIPSQGTCLGCRPGPSVGRTRGNRTLMFLSLPSPLCKNK